MNSRRRLQHTFGIAMIVLLLASCLGAQGPKQGHWEGEQPSVSFDITSDGDITNFVMHAPFAASTCDITIAEVTVEDNEFLVDAATMSENESSIGIFTITGDFDGTSVSVTFQVSVCGTMMSLNPEAKPWNAQWKGP